MILTITLNPSVDRRYTIDSFEKGQIFRTDDFQYTPGGKGINVTKVIRAFNEPVNATGFLGGRSGEYIRDKLDDMDINHNFISINGDTRSCLAILSDDGSQTEILESGPSVSSQKASKFYESYKEMLKDSEIICASGSLPKGLPVDTYRDLIIMAKEEEKKFILDTSGEALKLGIEAGPFLVKPNKEELEDLMGCKIESQEEISKAVGYIMENGVEIVVVSLGKSGSMVFYNGYCYKVTVPDVNVVNPVGSGDSLVAGLAVSLLRDYDIETMLKIGAACGTANVMEAETGKVDMNNMKKIMTEIEIEKTKMI